MDPLQTAQRSLTQLQRFPELDHALDSLLSGLELLSEENAFRTILVTSSQPLEGKTTIALNLGIAAATTRRKRVLLIDGDLRRPSLHQHLGRSRSPGFADLLRGASSYADVVQNIARPTEHSGDDGIAFIPSGTAGPDFLASLNKAQARSVLAKVSEQFDLVLLDSPPVLAANDAAILSFAVDGIIFVVDAGKVNERNANLARERLEQSDTPILGVVLNRFVESAYSLSTHPYPGYWEDAKRNVAGTP